MRAPEALQKPHSMTYTCTGLYMFVSKSKQWPQLKLLHFCPYHRLIFKFWFFQPFSLSDSFGNCQSLHHATVVFLSGSEQTALWFQMWLGIQMTYRLGEYGGYTLQVETRKCLLYLFSSSSSWCKIFPGILGSDWGKMISVISTIFIFPFSFFSRISYTDYYYYYY